MVSQQPSRGPWPLILTCPCCAVPVGDGVLRGHPHRMEGKDGTSCTAATACTRRLQHCHDWRLGGSLTFSHSSYSIECASGWPAMPLRLQVQCCRHTKHQRRCRRNCVTVTVRHCTELLKLPVKHG